MYKLSSTCILLNILLLCIQRNSSRSDEARGEEPQRPNIIFMFSDDHALQAISAYGSKINHTPNIDRLAREGMLFRHAMVTNSICAPSRAVILTGKYSHLNGVRTNGNTFDSTQTTFPKLLQKEGYQTAMIGKWHLKTEPTGFDYWKVLPGQGQYYNPEFRTPEGREQQQGYVTDLVTDEAIDWLERRREKGQPFLLMYQQKAPHRKWLPGPDHLNMYDDAHIPEPATLFDDYGGRASGAKNQEMEIGEHMDLIFDNKVFELMDSTNLDQYSNYKKRMYNRLTRQQWQTFYNAYKDENKDFLKESLEGKALIR